MRGRKRGKSFWARDLWIKHHIGKLGESITKLINLIKLKTKTLIKKWVTFINNRWKELITRQLKVRRLGAKDRKSCLS
jgi:hypothetical protein